MSEQEKLIEDLLDTDGVLKVRVKSRIEVTVKRRNTRRETENYQLIRERVASEEEIERTAGTDWSYSSNVNDKGDFRTVDLFINQFTYDK